MTAGTGVGPGVVHPRASAPRPLRILFLNENLGGHVTMHRAIRATIGVHDDVEATFVDVPPRGLGRRLASAAVPGLGGLDLDFVALRSQLALSLVARRMLHRLTGTYDVLHVYTQHAALLSAGIVGTAPTIVSTDATGDQVSELLPYRLPTRFTPLQNALRRPFERRVYEAATFVVAKSAWCEGSLRHVYGVPDGKLRRIPFGVPVPGAVRCEASTGLPQVTFIGTTLARKGGERLLRVYGSRLHGRCELNMVTRDVVAPQPGVRVFADFEPGDPRLTELLRRTAVLAFPTEMDSFGYAALEAMAMGVPVVGTRLHALPEIVDDGVTGLLVEPDDGQLAGALELLLADEPLRHAMGDAARSRVQSRFDARITTGAVVDLAFEAYDRFRFGAAAGARA